MREISSVTRRSGITVAWAICSIWTLWPFTGGRSWNIVSHFQRSMGLLAFSQCSALTGRLNTVSVRVAYSGRADMNVATSARTCCEVV